MALTFKTADQLDPASTPTVDDLLTIFQSGILKKLTFDQLQDTLLLGTTDGREIELQNNATHLQWRYEGDPSWINLLELSTVRGTDGSTIISGTGAPFSGLGNNGDYYIDRIAKNLHGPKAGGTWPAGVSLTGLTGASAYEIAVANGFVGTQEDWLASLQSGGVGGGAFTVQPNNGLIYAGDVLYTRYNTQINDAVPSAPAGGAPATLASVWKTKSIVGVLDAILFPDTNPTYVLPELTLTASVSGIAEVGSYISQGLTLVGKKNDGGAFTLLVIKRNNIAISTNNSPAGVGTTDVPAQFGLADGNNPNYTYTSIHTDNRTVSPGSTTWVGVGTFAAGVARYNNKGVLDTSAALQLSTAAPQASAELTTDSFSVNGIYPYFWGKSSTLPTAASIAAAIQAGTATKVLSDDSGTFGAIDITFNASGQYIWFAAEAAMANKTTWRNTSVNLGTIGAGQFILAPVQYNVTSPQAYWSNVSYDIYISSSATTTVGTITFSP